MSLTAAQVTFLQRLVAERRPERSASEVARYFSEHFSLGVVVRGRVLYQPAHIERARRLLQAAGAPVKTLGPNASRADSAAYGGISEKDFSVAPHASSVAVKCLGGCMLDGRELHTPPAGYLVLTIEAAERVACDRLLLVENMETFRGLESYAWLDLLGKAVLVVFRGDTLLPNKDAAQLLARRAEPLWAFFDFDPAGLLMANAIEDGRLERILLPSAAWLESAADAPRGRQLFDAQLSAAEKALDGATHPQVTQWWRLMKRLRSAVTQERMLLAGGEAPPTCRPD